MLLPTASAVCATIAGYLFGLILARFESQRVGKIEIKQLPNNDGVGEQEYILMKGYEKELQQSKRGEMEQFWWKRVQPDLMTAMKDQKKFHEVKQKSIHFNKFTLEEFQGYLEETRPKFKTLLNTKGSKLRLSCIVGEEPPGFKLKTVMIPCLPQETPPKETTPKEKIEKALFSYVLKQAYIASMLDKSLVIIPEELEPFNVTTKALRKYLRAYAPGLKVEISGKRKLKLYICEEEEDAGEFDVQWTKEKWEIMHNTWPLILKSIASETCDWSLGARQIRYVRRELYALPSVLSENGITLQHIAMYFQLRYQKQAYVSENAIKIPTICVSNLRLNINWWDNEKILDTDLFP